VRPYYAEGGITIYHGDARSLMLGVVDPGVDCIVTDPPYGDTSLGWDRRVEGWMESSYPNSMWCFGSFRSWMLTHRDFEDAGWRYSQEVVWEKHNGSSFHADRFKRVHELAVHWYRGDWAGVYKDPPVTHDATARTVRRKHRPPHTGDIGASAYASEDGGPKLMRSVLQVRSCHGSAVHPTQKPTGILRPLITYSCPAGGVVLDPFMGSGSTLVAARECGRRAIGIEVDERYCEIAARRFDQATFFDAEAVA
jgi:site-specific DNA-methyltransferase (adenine-specific)